MSSDTATRLAGWLAAVLLDWSDIGVGGCVSLVRTERKSLARVLTPSALDLSLCLSLAMHAAMPFVCMLLPLSVCMGVAESAAADWPQVCCVSYVI
jgi:hypothetical protein